MSDFVICNLCDSPGTFAQAKEVAQIPCCVDYFKDEKFTVWRCVNCGSLHSKEDVNLVKYYDRYPFKNHKLDYHTTVAYNNRIAMLKARGVKSNAAILDYGCGAGVFLEFLAREGFTNINGYDAFIPKYSDISILEKKYDVVTSYDVIEHVPDPRQYLETLLRPLKAGGLLVLGTPNADFIGLKSKPYFQVELSQPYHRHIFSERSLLKMCKEYGLEPEHIYRRFYFDSFYPTVNTRFMWEYVNQNNGMLDVCVKALNWKQILGSPKLMFYALFGYFLPERGNILITFRNKAGASLGNTKRDIVNLKVGNA